MSDYSPYGIPRPVEVGREVRMGQRRSANRAVLFAIGGVLVLCVCLCIGIFGVVYVSGIFQSGGSAAINLPSFGGGPASTATPAGPTPVPFLKGAKNSDGLRLTLTAYQRPLPAQGIKIPNGQELVLITLRLENTRTTGAPLQFSTDDFKLVSPEGDNYSADTGGITTGSMLKTGEIAPGKTITGDLVYYVYSDVKDLFLEWDSADGSTIQYKLTR